MRFFYAVLFSMIVAAVVALTMPLPQAYIVTSEKQILGVTVGRGATYRVEAVATIALDYSAKRLVSRLMEDVAVTSESLRAAYTAAGYTDVKVTKISL